MEQIEKQGGTIAAYDDDAEASGWFSPEVVFGLTYKYTQPGQSILDLGVGTGLGSVLFHKAGLEVHGIDISEQMLDVCRCKGFKTLRLHDLRNLPYPFDTESMDHAVCTGVMNFFSDLSPLFEETARILRKGGLFAFVVGDRTEGEAHKVIVGPEHTMAAKNMTIYLHSPRQIDSWIGRNGFRLVRSLPFSVFINRSRTMSMQARAYLARK